MSNLLYYNGDKNMIFKSYFSNLNFLLILKELCSIFFNLKSSMRVSVTKTFLFLKFKSTLHPIISNVHSAPNIKCHHMHLNIHKPKNLEFTTHMRGIVLNVNGSEKDIVFSLILKKKNLPCYYLLYVRAYSFKICFLHHQLLRTIYICRIWIGNRLV